MTDRRDRIRTVRERRVYANPFGELFDDDVEFLPRGTHGTYVRWKWRAPFSVAVLPFTGNTTVVLLNSYRYASRGIVLEAVKGDGVAETRASGPADTFDSAIRATATAELQDEAGYTVSDLTPIGRVVTDPAFTGHPMYCFFATGELTGRSAPEHSEVILGIEHLDLTSVPLLLSSGRVSDAATLVLLWEAYHRLGARR